jgi:nucleotide-binding universal stress UspA family protein
VPLLSLGPTLCAVDLSAPSRRALTHAAAFAASLQTRLVVLRVAEAAAGEIGERAAAADDVDAFVRSTLQQEATSARQVEIMLRPGDPAHAILHAAAEISAGLIVVGTHGRGALVRAFIGSTAAAILRESAIPVAVVPLRRQETVAMDRGVPTLNVGTILVPLDLHADAHQQLTWAARLRPTAATPLVLLNVVAPGQARGIELDRVRAAAAHTLGTAPVRPIVREGRVVPEVITAVHQEHAGLVIMGRSADARGAMAYDILVRTDAIVLMTP